MSTTRRARWRGWQVKRWSQDAFCCGAGGGRMFLGEEKGKRANVTRVEELVSTGAQPSGRRVVHAARRCSATR
jgi:Fe-S oxidoreductase